MLQLCGAKTFLTSHATRGVNARSNSNMFHGSTLRYAQRLYKTLQVETRGMPEICMRLYACICHKNLQNVTLVNIT